MRKYNEIKFAVMSGAAALGTEGKLQAYFEKLEKIHPMNAMFEPDVRFIWQKTCMEYGVYTELHEALAYYDNLPKKRKSEAQTRQGILNNAEYLGIDKSVVLGIFNRIDNMLKSANTDLERHQIAVMGAAEIHKLLDCDGSLVIDGEEVIKGKETVKSGSFRFISE